MFSMWSKQQPPRRQALIRFSVQEQIKWCIVFLLWIHCGEARRGEKPQIIEEPKSATTIVGQSVLFVCLVDGNPAPKVHWKVSGTSVSESRLGKTFRAPRGSVLRVSNALPSHNGAIITCTATNALGQAESSATLTVYSDESAAPPGYPRFLNSFSVIVARKNAEVELECRATGEPPPVITWFKDSVPIDLHNPRYKKLDVGNLRIQNLIEEDEGKYECEAKNDKGTRLSSGDNLLVRDNVEASLQMLAPSTKRFRPHFTQLPSSRQIVPPGGRVTLTCTAVGAPVPTVQWYKDKHLPLQQDQLSKQPPGTAKLLLKDLSESLNVTCVAESTMGRIYHDIQVIVKNLPNPPGEFQLMELGATHARIALKPSSSPSESVRNYLILWLPTSQFNNETLYELPNQANLLISQSVDQTEPLISSNPEDLNLIILPKSLKNLTGPSLVGNYHQASSIRDVDANQQSLLSSQPAGSNLLHNVLIISLTQLKPYTEYTVWARCVGQDGDTSLPSETFSFTTKEIAPSSPPLHVHAQALSNAAVTVYWDPPNEPNGRIRAYRIYYTNNPTLEFSYWDTSIVNLQALKSPSASGTSESRSLPGHLSILSHLTTNATYYIRVSAVNGQGEGPASDVSVVIVRPGVLSRPQSFNATTRSSHEVYLTWKPPSDVDPNLRPLEYYELNYTKVSDLKTSDRLITWYNQPQPQSQPSHLQSQQQQQYSMKDRSEISIRINSVTTSYLIDNLEPDTRYAFSLVAVSKTGPGVKASAFAQTNPFIPSAPSNLSVQAISSNQLQVKWQRPIFNNPHLNSQLSTSRIAYYDLNWRQSDSEGNWLRGSDTLSVNPHQSSWGNQQGTNPAALNEANNFGSLQVPVHRESTGNYTTTWYTANITGLQPSTYYVVQLKAVSPSGSGDKATSRPVKTWDEPPPAPQRLRLLSQIIPQLNLNQPPQILIHLSWEPIQPISNDIQIDKPIVYRIRWRLVGNSYREQNYQGQYLTQRRRRRRMIPSSSDKSSIESTLYWSIIDSSQQREEGEEEGEQQRQGEKNPFQSELLIPGKYLHGEVNLTETTWNSPPDIFLLGMTYEFRVAVITPLQVGYEAVETLALEGRAPSNTPTSLQVTYSLDHILLSWNPPEWLHRHGIFEAYELKCYSPKVVGSILQQNTTNNQADVLQSYTSSQYSRYQQQNFNITLLNSRIQWPISAPNDLVNIIPWPNGQIQLSIPQEFSYKYRGEVDSSETNQNDNNNNNNEVYACIIRARNMYGTGPWSLEKIILPRKPSVPPPPENIRAIFMHKNLLRISWSLPPDMIQTISPKLIRRMKDKELEKFIAYSGNSYSRFAVYISPKLKTNWKRYVTKGPTTEIVLDEYNEETAYLVRVSSISTNEHESKWSEPISTQRIKLSRQSSLSTKVYNLQCQPFYRTQTNLWELQLTWEIPKQLQISPQFEKLSHYRINYTLIKSSTTPSSSSSKYTSVHLSQSRESSLHVLESYKHQFILRHWLYTGESNSVYSVSVRPVFKGPPTTDEYINEQPYGVIENTLCYIPKKDTIYVPIPSIISNPLVDKSSYFLIGLNLIKWVFPLMATATTTTKTRTQDIPVIYELIAYKLPIPHNLHSADVIKLGQWNSSQLTAYTTSESQQQQLQQQQVYIELSQPMHDTSLRYEKGSAKRLIGKELPRSQDYALSTRACLRPSKQFYSLSPSIDSHSRQEVICYESKWLQPVSTNRPSPSTPVNDSLNQLYDDTKPYDPDKFLWSSNPFGSQSPPPSDDATAQGPGRESGIESSIRENRQSNDISGVLDEQTERQLSENIKVHDIGVPDEDRDDDHDDDKSMLNNLQLSPSLSPPSHNSQMTLLTAGVSLTALILIFGLVCFLIILCKRRRLSDVVINKYQITENHHKTAISPSAIQNNTDNIQFKTRYKLSYAILRRLAFHRRRKSQRKLFSSFNLTEMHCPPPGIGSSIAANLHSTPLAYEFSGYTNPTANNGLLYSQSNGEIRNFTNSLDTTNNNNNSSNNNTAAEMNPNYASDSPNTTLCQTDNNNPYTPSRLNRADSISMSYRPCQLMNSPPSPSTVYNNINTSGYMKSGQNDLGITCNGVGGALGSLKSVSTMGSKSLQPLNSTDYPGGMACGMLSPISNGRGRNMLSSVPSRPQLYKPILVSNLIEYVQNLKADNGRLMAAEFESIDPGGPFTWEHSNRPGNRNKNRYANVVAYDHSRVILQLNSAMEPDSDYINANYLDGYCKQNAYIATQGPLPHTINDFWRMVWEQHSAMIVSMTRLEEKARIKCEQYWPGSIGLTTNGNAVAGGVDNSSNMNVGGGIHSNSVLLSCKPSPSISSRLNSSASLTSCKKANDFKMKVYDNKGIFPPPVNFRTSLERGNINNNRNNNVDDDRDEDDDDEHIPLNGGDLMFTNGFSHLSQGTVNFGDISVSLLDTIELAYYTVRSFVLQKVGTSERREVRQLQFTAWPDHGVPNHPAPLLMFLRRVRAECPANSGPIIVHCSAGVGRTGAFILLDILLEQMRHEKAVDVFSAVSRLRAQRNFMVQTEDQYAFIYEALVEAASSGNTEIPVQQLTNHWTRLTDLNRIKCQDHHQLNSSDQISLSVKSSVYTNSTISTGLELEFYHLLTQSNLTKLISSIPSSIGLLSPIDPISNKEDERGGNGCSSIPRLPPPIGLGMNKTGLAATLPVNIPKNRNLTIIPHDANRVALKAVRGVDGSDYINASYIDGYRSRAGYIATQAPMNNTLEDFWRMIWESGSCLIVKLDSTLTPSIDGKFIDSPTYWPNLQSARHGFLVVDPIATYTMPAYIMRELRLTDTRDGSSRTIRQFDASCTANSIIHLEKQTCATSSNSSEFLVESSPSITTTATTTGGIGCGRGASLSPNPLLLETSFTEDDYLRVNHIPSQLLTTFRQCYQPLCESMLELISQVHKTKEHFGMEGPITVHCNLGAGITGIFLAISLVLERMRYEGVVDMFQTVKLLRWQRPGLVQTASEYAFCYATALEYLESFERYTT